MATDAATILAAVKVALQGAYPLVPVHTSKRRATGKQAQGGYAQGYPIPCFVLSCSDGEEIDGAGTFEHVTVGYAVAVEYVKSAQAVVVGAVDSGPAPVIEDDDVREKRATIRATLYKSVSAARVFDARLRELPVYEHPDGAHATLLVSGATVTYTTLEGRP